jgi:hypothetical protein
MKTIFASMVLALAFGTGTTATLVYASEKSCYDRDYEAGITYDPFDIFDYAQCRAEPGDNAGAYHAGYMDGCAGAGNSKEACEITSDDRYEH